MSLCAHRLNKVLVAFSKQIDLEAADVVFFIPEFNIVETVEKKADISSTTR